MGTLPRMGPTLNKIIDGLSIRGRTTAPATATQEGKKASPVASLPVAPAPRSAGAIPGEARIGNILPVLTFAFATSRLMALLYEGLLVLYLLRSGQLPLALPFLLLSLFLIFVYGAPWHLGLLWITGLMILWAAWDSSIPAGAPQLQNAVAATLGLLCVLQLPWTFAAFRFDAGNPTSPGKATAAYLKTLPSGSRIAGFGMSVGVQPYFRHNVFFNRSEAFASFAQDAQVLSIAQTVALHPDFIVADENQASAIQSFGYRPIQRFCGTLYFPNSAERPSCLSIYKPPVMRTYGEGP
jgi:hypothetical protein